MSSKKKKYAILPPGCLAGHPQEFLWSFRRAGEEKFMKVLSLSSPLPWIVHRRIWKDLRQALSPLWSYSPAGRIDVSGIKKGRGFAAGCVEGLCSLRSGGVRERFKGCGSGSAAVFGRRLAVSSA